jgi:hypothetical protein
MNNYIDIIDIDRKIISNFKEEEKQLPNLKKTLEEIRESLKLRNIRSRVINTLKTTENEIDEHIKNIENFTSLNFYITETACLIEKYKDILKCPTKINFIGKPVKNNKDKIKIINEYLEIARKYVNIDIDIDQPPNEIENKKEKLTCNNCANKKEFEIIDINIYICCMCSAQQLLLKNISSYKDVDRVNISSKYLYDRKIHFRDCVNQYQGDSILCVFFAKICIFPIENYFSSVNTIYPFLT